CTPFPTRRSSDLVEFGRVLVGVADDEGLQVGGASEDADGDVRLELLLTRQCDNDLGGGDRIDGDVVLLRPGAHAVEDRLGVGAHLIKLLRSATVLSVDSIGQNTPRASQHPAGTAAGRASRTAAAVRPQAKRSA